MRLAFSRLDLHEDEMSRQLKASDSRKSLLLERVETPLGIEAKRLPSLLSETTSHSSGEFQAPKRVSRRLEGRFDTVAGDNSDNSDNSDKSDKPPSRNPHPPAKDVSNLPELLRSVARLAESDGGFSIQELWQDLRSYAQVQLLERLVAMADAVDETNPGGFVFKPQSVGLCYVNPTESQQYGCESYEPLPPVTIRPLLEGEGRGRLPSPDVTASLSETLLSGKTVTSVIASVSSDETLIKRYLLESNSRSRILQHHQGSLMSGEDLGKLFRKAGDKGFVCFHYKLDRLDGDGGGEGGGEVGRLVLRGLSNAKASLAASNAPLAVTVKKGVGGTAGMKSEARLLDKGALLGLLLGEDPEALLKYYATLSKVESMQSMQSNNMLSAEDEEVLEDKPVVAEKKLPLHSLCCRVDLYLDKETWSTLSQREMAELMAATKRFGEHFSGVMRRQNWSRHLEHLKATRTGVMKDFVDGDMVVEEDEDSEDSEDSEQSEDSDAEYDADGGDRGKKKRTGRRAKGSSSNNGNGNGNTERRPNASRVKEIRGQVDSLLEAAMSSLRTKDSSAAAVAQQSFLKMHVSCLALAASHKRSRGHAGHSSHVLPMYMVSTRDCFSSDIVGEVSRLATEAGRPFIKTTWFIQSSEAPPNFDATLEGLCAKEVVVEDDLDDRGEDDEDDEDGDNGDNGEDNREIDREARDRQIQATDHANIDKDSVEGMVDMILDGMVSTVVQATEAGRDLQPDCADNYLLPLGVTTYNGLYDPEDMQVIESNCDVLHRESVKGTLPKECFHETSTKTGSLKRTKYFFGSRYLWSREQLKHPQAKIAGGIRRDVPKPPAWMHEMVEQPMVSADLAPAGFVDAIALNMYHDGSEGIQSHYDDAKRFQQPIYSLRLFSDSRLSFGTQLYGFTNGLFFVPMPRGCVTVMEDSGYAANGVKHCVRPIDMTGKSAAMILRKINEDALEVAEALFWEESLHKLECLTLEPTKPDELIWNPLFDSDSKTMDKETSLLLQRLRDEKKDERMIKAMVGVVVVSLNSEGEPLSLTRSLARPFVRSPGQVHGQGGRAPREATRDPQAKGEGYRRRHGEARVHGRAARHRPLRGRAWRRRRRRRCQ